jgi:transcriptional regulator with XRE-family HTH domain
MATTPDAMERGRLMNKQASLKKGEPADSAGDAIVMIGSRIRELRTAKEMKLQELAAETGLSLSMLSLVERGKTSPSISTLMVICSALGIHMGDLLAPASRGPNHPVAKMADQAVFQTAEGVKRRILRDDRANGVEIAINEYAARTGSGPVPVHHEGHEYGIVLEGELTVELDGVEHKLKAGDLISYSSSRDHRIWNYSGRKAKALWVNLHR